MLPLPRVRLPVAPHPRRSSRVDARGARSAAADRLRDPRRRPRPRCVQRDLGDADLAGPKLLRIRFTDSDLTAMANRVQSRASKAGARTSASLLPPPPVVEIIPDDPDAPRASKRKRKPTAALLAALADDDEPECVASDRRPR